MRHFFIDPSAISGKTALVSGSDAHHIRKVLRLKPGDTIGLFDGQGFEYHAEIVSFSTSGVEISIIRRFTSETESPVRLTVAQGFLKERKMDQLVRPLTELGVTRWIPFLAGRSVPKPKAKQLTGRIERWETISKQALKQCKRARSIEIGNPLSFEETLLEAQSFDLKIVFWEKESKPLNEIINTTPDLPIRTIFTIIGPEGGLTEQEIERAKASGFVPTSLGPRILRAETATLAACSLVQFLFGDMGKKPLT